MITFVQIFAKSDYKLGIYDIYDLFRLLCRGRMSTFYHSLTLIPLRIRAVVVNG